MEINRRDMRIGGSLLRSLHLGKWPRSLAPGFLQGLMAAGAPMDLSVHVGPIPTEQAARTLEWQKVRFESAQSLSLKRGRTMSPEAEIALEDITRLRGEVQRGRERLFHASLSVTLHAKDEASLKEMTQRAKAHFAATLGKLDNLAFRQREGLLSTLPMALNAVAEWRSLDTSSIARLFPFSPPDLDTRSGSLYGIDMRACSPVVYDPWDGTHLNANTAVLARSGSGKSFATKLGVLRGLCRGVTAYVIDPEGEYADMARAAGGRVLSPGVPGEGMNPFVIDKGDSEEMLQRTERGEDTVGDVGEGQPPDPLAALHLVPLQVRLGARRRTAVIARPSPRVDRHVVRPLQAPARLEHAEGEVENTGRHPVGEERAQVGRGGPGELPYAPRRVGVPPRADLTVGARQSRGPLDGVVAVPRVEGVDAVLELPYEVALRGVAASYVLDRDDVPAGGEVPRRRRVGLGRLVIRDALEQHRVAAAGGRAVDVRAEHRPAPRLHRNVLSDSYVETGHRPTPFACSDVTALPGPGAAAGRVFPEFRLILFPFVAGPVDSGVHRRDRIEGAYLTISTKPQPATGAPFLVPIATTDPSQ